MHSECFSTKWMIFLRRKLSWVTARTSLPSMTVIPETRIVKKCKLSYRLPRKPQQVHTKTRYLLTFNYTRSSAEEKEEEEEENQCIDIYINRINRSLRARTIFVHSDLPWQKRVTDILIISSQWKPGIVIDIYIEIINIYMSVTLCSYSRAEWT